MCRLPRRGGPDTCTPHVRADSRVASVSNPAMATAIIGYPPSTPANAGPATGASAVPAVIGATKWKGQGGPLEGGLEAAGLGGEAVEAGDVL